MSKRTIGMGGFTHAGATHVDMFTWIRKSFPDLGRRATHVDTSTCIRKPLAGFTLAEVLITLGIIGVVAAMTMPTLINSTNGAQYKTAFKKALSVMSQAVAMNIALNDYDLSEIITGANPSEGEDAANLDEQPQTIYSIFRNRLNVVKIASGADFNATPGDSKYYPILTDRDSADRSGFQEKHTNDNDNDFVATNTTAEGSGTQVGHWDEESTLLFMNDGITLIFDNTQSDCHQATANLEDNYCYAFIDVNGQKGPNKVVECDTGSGSPTGGDGQDDYACTVSNPTDIYPIAMYNQTIIPASAAARAVLFAK